MHVINPVRYTRYIRGIYKGEHLIQVLKHITMSKEKKHEDQFEHIEDALTKGEQFIENNQKMLVNAVIIILVIIGAFLGYNKFIKNPKIEEASSQIFGAQNYFEKDSSIWH